MHLLRRRCHITMQNKIHTDDDCETDYFSAITAFNGRRTKYFKAIVQNFYLKSSFILVFIQ